MGSVNYYICRIYTGIKKRVQRELCKICPFPKSSWNPIIEWLIIEISRKCVPIFITIRYSKHDTTIQNTIDIVFIHCHIWITPLNEKLGAGSLLRGSAEIVSVNAELFIILLISVKLYITLNKQLFNKAVKHQLICALTIYC